MTGIVSAITVERYVIALVAGAAAALGASAVLSDASGYHSFVVAALAAGFALTLAFPLRMTVGSEVEGLEFQEALLLPAILLVPAPVGLGAFAVAATAAMVVRRRGLLRGAFNVSQWVLAAAAGYGIFGLLHGSAPPLSARAVLAAVAAVAIASVCNLIAVGLALALSTGRRLSDVLAGGNPVRVALLTSNLALGVLLAVAGHYEPYLLAVAIVPAVFLHLAYRAVAERRADGVQLQRLGDAEVAIAGAPDPDGVAAELAGHVQALLHTRGASVQIGWFGQELSASAGDPDDSSTPRWGAGAVERRATVSEDVWLAVRANARGNLDPHGERDERIVDALVRRGVTTLARLRLFEEVLNERRLVMNIVASSSDGIFAVADDQRVSSWNPAMEAITGFGADDVVGGKCFTVYRPRDEEGRDLCPGACPGRAGGGEAAAVQVATASGEQRWLHCTYSQMPEGGYVVVARDVTAQKEVDDLKADFLATVSHELQTPLTPIKGFLQTLLRDDTAFGPEERARFYDMMLRQSDRLERLVKDLLLATSLSDRDQLFLPETLDWARSAVNVVELYRRQEPDREFIVEVEPGLPAVVADEQRAEQVLSNLLANATKYSPAGSPVRVAIGLRGEAVATSVADRGPGIPARDRERIFERFSRLGDHLTRQVGGAGLGLFIARRLVEAMGGSIWMSPEPEGGSEFTFTLPVYQDARPRV